MIVHTVFFSKTNFYSTILGIFSPLTSMTCSITYFYRINLFDANISHCKSICRLCFKVKRCDWIGKDKIRQPKYIIFWVNENLSKIWSHHFFKVFLFLFNFCLTAKDTNYYDFIIFKEVANTCKYLPDNSLLYWWEFLYPETCLKLWFVFGGRPSNSGPSKMWSPLRGSKCFGPRIVPA